MHVPNPYENIKLMCERFRCTLKFYGNWLNATLTSDAFGSHDEINAYAKLFYSIKFYKVCKTSNKVKKTTIYLTVVKLINKIKIVNYSTSRFITHYIILSTKKKFYLYAHIIYTQHNKPRITGCRGLWKLI